MKYSKNHTVYYNNNNNEVPSVTTILKILNKPALVHWANHLGFQRKDVATVLEETSTVGTIVHQAINILLREGEYVYIKSDKEPPLSYLAPYLKPFLRWQHTNTIQPIFLEKPFSCDSFGGTIDFYGKVNNKLTIIDFKTAKKIRLGMMLQLALYCVLMERHGHKVEQVGIVLCNPIRSDVRYIQRDELNEYISIAELLVELFHKYYDINEKDDWKEGIL